MSEKRKYPRTPVELDVVFSLDGKEIVGRSRDLSIGGMFIFTDQMPAFGASIELGVHFGGALGTLSFPSVVRWRDKDGFGVQFGLLGARETYAIAQTLSKAKSGS